MVKALKFWLMAGLMLVDGETLESMGLPQCIVKMVTYFMKGTGKKIGIQEKDREFPTLSLLMK